MYYKKKSKNMTISTDELLDDYNIPITPPHRCRSESPPPRPVKIKNPRLYLQYPVKRPHILTTLTLLIIFVGVLSCQFIYNFGKSEIQKVSKDKKSILTVSAAEDKKRSILTRLKNLPNTFENKF